MAIPTVVPTNTFQQDMAGQLETHVNEIVPVWAKTADLESYMASRTPAWQKQPSQFQPTGAVPLQPDPTPAAPSSSGAQSTTYNLLRLAGIPLPADSLSTAPTSPTGASTDSITFNGATNPATGSPGGFVAPAASTVAAAPGSDVTPDQFGDRSLSTAEAYSACGPAAVVAFARLTGRNPTLRETTDLAYQYGWTPGIGPNEGGMGGVANWQNLAKAEGVNTRLDPTSNWGAITQAAESGKPVAVSTAAHYFVINGYDPATGKYYVGQSGRALRGGSDWMTQGEIEQRGAANGALYLDEEQALVAPNPKAPTPTQEQTTSSVSPDVGASMPAPVQLADMPPVDETLRIHDPWLRTLGLGVADVGVATGAAGQWIGSQLDKSIPIFGDVITNSKELERQSQAVETANVEEKPAEFQGVQSLIDPEFLRQTVVRGLPTMAIGIGLALAGGALAGAIAGTTGAAMGLGAVGIAATKAVAQTVGGATLMTLQQGVQDAGQVYVDQKRQGLSEEQATDNARNLFWKDFAMLPLNALQFETAFKSLPQPIKAALNRAIHDSVGRDLGLGVAKVLGTAGVAGTTSVMQTAFQQQAYGKNVSPLDVGTDPSLQQAGIVGGAMGAVMSAPNVAAHWINRLPTPDDLSVVGKAIQDRSGFLDLGVILGDKPPTVLSQAEVNPRPGEADAPDIVLAKSIIAASTSESIRATLPSSIRASYDGLAGTIRTYSRALDTMSRQVGDNIQGLATDPVSRTLIAMADRNGDAPLGADLLVSAINGLTNPTQSIADRLDAARQLNAFTRAYSTLHATTPDVQGFDAVAAGQAISSAGSILTRQGADAPPLTLATDSNENQAINDTLYRARVLARSGGKSAAEIASLQKAFRTSLLRSHRTEYSQSFDSSPELLATKTADLARRLAAEDYRGTAGVVPPTDTNGTSTGTETDTSAGAETGANPIDWNIKPPQDAPPPDPNMARTLRSHSPLGKDFLPNTDENSVRSISMVDGGDLDVRAARTALIALRGMEGATAAKTVNDSMATMMKSPRVRKALAAAGLDTPLDLKGKVADNPFVYLAGAIKSAGEEVRGARMVGGRKVNNLTNQNYDAGRYFLTHVIDNMTDPNATLQDSHDAAVKLVKYIVDFARLHQVKGHAPSATLLDTVARAFGPDALGALTRRFNPEGRTNAAALAAKNIAKSPLAGELSLDSPATNRAIVAMNHYIAEMENPTEGSTPRAFALSFATEALNLPSKYLDSVRSQLRVAYENGGSNKGLRAIVEIMTGFKEEYDSAVSARNTLIERRVSLGAEQTERRRKAVEESNATQGIKATLESPPPDKVQLTLDEMLAGEPDVSQRAVGDEIRLNKPDGSGQRAFSKPITVVEVRGTGKRQQISFLNPDNPDDRSIRWSHSYYTEDLPSNLRSLRGEPIPGELAIGDVVNRVSKGGVVQDTAPVTVVSVGYEDIHGERKQFFLFQEEGKDHLSGWPSDDVEVVKTPEAPAGGGGGKEPPPPGNEAPASPEDVVPPSLDDSAPPSQTDIDRWIAGGGPALGSSVPEIKTWLKAHPIESAPPPAGTAGGGGSGLPPAKPPAPPAPGEPPPLGESGVGVTPSSTTGRVWGGRTRATPPVPTEKTGWMFTQWATRQPNPNVTAAVDAEANSIGLRIGKGNQISFVDSASPDVQKYANGAKDVLGRMKSLAGYSDAEVATLGAALVSPDVTADLAVLLGKPETWDGYRELAAQVDMSPQDFIAMAKKGNNSFTPGQFQAAMVLSRKASRDLKALSVEIRDKSLRRDAVASELTMKRSRGQEVTSEDTARLVALEMTPEEQVRVNMGWMTATQMLALVSGTKRRAAQMLQSQKMTLSSALQDSLTKRVIENNLARSTHELDLQLAAVARLMKGLEGGPLKNITAEKLANWTVNDIAAFHALVGEGWEAFQRASRLERDRANRAAGVGAVRQEQPGRRVTPGGRTASETVPVGKGYTPDMDPTKVSITGRPLIPGYVEKMMIFIRDGEKNPLMQPYLDLVRTGLSVEELQAAAARQGKLFVEMGPGAKAALGGVDADTMTSFVEAWARDAGLISGGETGPRMGDLFNNLTPEQAKELLDSIGQKAAQAAAPTVSPVVPVVPPVPVGRVGAVAPTEAEGFIGPNISDAFRDLAPDQARAALDYIRELVVGPNLTDAMQGFGVNEARAALDPLRQGVDLAAAMGPHAKSVFDVFKPEQLTKLMEFLQSGTDFNDLVDSKLIRHNPLLNDMTDIELKDLMALAIHRAQDTEKAYVIPATLRVELDAMRHKRAEVESLKERAAGLTSVDLVQRQQDVATILTKTYGRAPTQVEMLQMSKILGNPNATNTEIASFLRLLSRTTWFDRMTLLRYNSILSATTLTVRNLVGNTAKLATIPMTRLGVVGLDVARVGMSDAYYRLRGMTDPVTGKPRTARRAAYLAEVGQLFSGGIEGHTLGLKDALTLWNTGVNVRNVGKLLNEGGSRLDYGLKIEDTAIGQALAKIHPGAPDFVNCWSTLATTGLAFGDIYFRGVGTGAEMNALIIRRAISDVEAGKITPSMYPSMINNQGNDLSVELRIKANEAVLKRSLTPEEHRQVLIDLHATAIKRNLELYPDIMAKADRLAAEAVFQEVREHSTGMKFINTVRNSTGPLGAFIKLVIPFVHTAYNVTMQTGEFSPLGLIRVFKLIQQEIDAGRLSKELASKGERLTFDQVEMRHENTFNIEEAISRTVLGTVISLFAYNMGLAGVLTAERPKDPREGSTLPEGWMPWSFKIADPQGNPTYVDFSQMDMLSIPLMAGATLAEVTKRGEQNSPATIWAAIDGAAQFIESSTYWQGLAELTSAMTSPSTAPLMLNGITQQFMPMGGLQRQAMRAAGLPAREIGKEWGTSQFNSWAAGSPLTAGMVPPKLNALGQEKKPTVTGVIQAMMPYNVATEQSNPVLAELHSHYVELPKAGNIIYLRQMPLALLPDEQKEYDVILGAQFNKMLSQAIATDSYRNASTTAQSLMLTRVMAAAKRVAEAMMKQNIQTRYPTGANSFTDRINTYRTGMAEAGRFSPMPALSA